MRSDPTSYLHRHFHRKADMYMRGKHKNGWYFVVGKTFRLRVDWGQPWHKEGWECRRVRVVLWDARPHGLGTGADWEISRVI